jgi:hypothetical protein
MKKLHLIIILTLLASCNAMVRNNGKAYIKIEKSPSLHTIQKLSKLWFYLDSKTTIEEQKAIELLKDEIRELGYKITFNKQHADFIIFLNMDTPIYTSTFYNVSDPGFGSSTITPSTTSTVYKKMYIRLFKKEAEGELGIMLWSSFVSIKEKDYEKSSSHTMKTIAKYFGKEFRGNVVTN